MYACSIIYVDMICINRFIQHEQADWLGLIYCFILTVFIRREAYAALKDGVESVQEDNEKLEDDILARWDWFTFIETSKETDMEA